MASPLFRINGGAVGVKASVSAGGAVTATLDSTDGVRTTEWFIDTTDDLSAPADYTLTPSGSVNQTVSTTALGVGTAAKLRARINGGVNVATGLADPTATNATAKFFVPTSVGREVGAAGEEFESDATNGSTGIINAAVRDAGGVTPADVLAALAAAASPVDINGQALTDCGGVKLRNDAGSGTIDGLHRDTGDILRIGENTNVLGIRISTSAAGFIDFNFNGTAALRVTSTALAFQTSAASNLNAPAELTISADTGAGGNDLIFRKSGSEKLRIVSGGLQIEKGYTFSLTQPQSTSGAGRALTIQAQQGLGSGGGTDGGSLILTAGDAGIAATNAQGEIVFALGKSGDLTGIARWTGGAFGNLLTVSYDDTVGDTLVSSPTYNLAIQSALAVSISASSGDVALSAGGSNSVTLSAGSLGIEVQQNAGLKIGVNGNTPVARPSVTGSRGGNAALASFLTALDSIGWITDNTTA